jgi:hypothetical protein
MTTKFPPPTPERREQPAVDDTISRSLSDEDRAKLAIDSWEPSLLRHLLAAHNKLKRHTEN